MGSQQQVIVGVLLLACAFLFGRYIHTKPVEGDKEYSELVGAADPSAEVPNGSIFRRTDTSDLDNSRLESTIAKPSSNSLQQSLRERILGKRFASEKPIQPSNNLAKSSPINSSGNPLELSEPKPLNRFKDDVVQPDFSQLDSISSTLIESQSDKRSQAGWEDGKQIPLERGLDRVVVGPLHKVTSNEKPPENSNVDLRSQNFRERYAPAQPEPSEMSAIVQPPRDMNTRQRSERDHGITSLKSQSRLTRVKERSQRLSIIAQEHLTHTSEPGDTLHSISNKFYGKPNYYLDIYVANRDRLQNPSVIPAGLKLKIPVYSN